MRAIFALALLLGATTYAGAEVPTDATVPAYHGDPARSGDYITPGLDWQTVSRMHRDTRFEGRVDGQIYAQPLYWRAPGATHGLIIVATENNVVAALDAETGRTVWQVTLGSPAPYGALPCGDISPLGITGTPVIDASAGAIYLDAMVNQARTPQHLAFGLRASDGAVLSGWPINVEAALQQFAVNFIPRQQNERAALALLNSRVFIAFSGHFGDCGTYHGIVLGIATTPPHPVAAWATRGVKGGIWSPAGISIADGALFFTTGNTATPETWGDGEGVFRLGPDLAHSDNPHDYYAPKNWKELDDGDLDLSGAAPLPVDVPGNGGPAHRLVAFGKDGNAYLLNRDNLGSIGGQIAIHHAGGVPIITSPALISAGQRALVVYQARNAACPDGRRGAGLAALAVTASNLSPAWCAQLDGRGEPIVSTTDGIADPIVWVAGAEGDGKLHAFRGDTGEPLWTSPQTVSGLRRFVTILAAEDRLYIAGDGQVSAFTWSGQ
jgi:outer membrane protein assembly factor BamB